VRAHDRGRVVSYDSPPFPESVRMLGGGRVTNKTPQIQFLFFPLLPSGKPPFKAIPGLLQGSGMSRRHDCISAR